jgi:ubiquinone/menaquinone biosynthesis C-methylase UbiE
MKLSTPEFRAMNSALRRAGQRYFELPMFRRLGLTPRGRELLEVGCGSGFGAVLLNQLRLKRYLGFDVMGEQLAIARQNYPQFDFRQLDAADLSSLPAASFDDAVIFGVLHHIPRWRLALDELTRVLRPGGRLFLEEPRGADLRLFDFFFRWAHPDSDFSLRGMESHLLACGWTLVRRQWTPLLTMYHWGKGMEHKDSF